MPLAEVVPDIEAARRKNSFDEQRRVIHFGMLPFLNRVCSMKYDTAEKKMGTPFVACCVGRYNGKMVTSCPALISAEACNESLKQLPQ
jgi:hypothetical protein